MILPHGDEELDARLDKIEELFESGDLHGAWDVVLEGREVYPEDPQLRFWEGTLLLENGEATEALDVFQALLVQHPDMWPARMEQGCTLLELGRFQEALQSLQQTEEEARDEMVVGELVHLVFGKAQCLDRLGRLAEADEQFRRATALAPERFPLPSRLSAEDFQGAVDEALESIDEGLLEHLRQVVLVVRDYPTPDQVATQNAFLLGLYVGVPRTERGQETTDHLDHIFIFKRNLEIEFPEREELVEQIRITVIHEVAHHFGLGEDAMGEYA